jgi:hypothetical protein
MKIEYSHTNEWRLSSIAVGEVFEYDNTLFLKTNELATLNSERVCVCLENGLVMLIDETDFVYKCEAKIVVE